MKQSSFGFIKVCDHAGQKVEYLEFVREGRFHKHNEPEHFTVLEGFGELITTDEICKIEEGKTYTVPSGVDHKMKPLSACLKIVLSYS